MIRNANLATTTNTTIRIGSFPTNTGRAEKYEVQSKDLGQSG